MPTILEVFSKNVDQYGEQTALQTLAPKGKGFVTINYRDLDALSNRVAAGLLDRGIKAGAKVGILAKPRPEFAASMLGIMKIGAVAVPLDPLLQSGEVHRLLGACDIEVLIAGGDHFDDVRELAIPELVINIDAEGDLEGNRDLSWTQFLSDSDVPKHIHNLDELAVFLNTSGTMGDAKPVMLAHQNFSANISGVMERLDITHNDVILSIAPWNHSFGLIVLMAVLWNGCKLIYTNDYANLSKTMFETRPTIVVAVPKLFHAMYQRVEQNINASFAKRALARFAPKMIGRGLRKKLGGDRLRFFASGSAPLSPRVMSGFRRFGLGMIEGYGMTEATPVLTFSTEFNNKIGSVGPPLSNVELKLIDKNEEGIGELLARGPNIMQGYYKNESRTREMIDEEGWLHTGDLATLDNDGWLYIRGRKKNLIVLESGKNVYPEEIEWELGRSPYIEEIMVRRGNRKNVEVIQALVYPNFEEIPAGLSTEELHNLIWADIRARNQNLASYKRLRSDQDLIVLEEPFEKTSLKDIKRYKYLETVKS